MELLALGVGNHFRWMGPVSDVETQGISALSMLIGICSVSETEALPLDEKKTFPGLWQLEVPVSSQMKPASRICRNSVLPARQTPAHKPSILGQKTLAMGQMRGETRSCASETLVPTSVIFFSSDLHDLQHFY